MYIFIVIVRLYFTGTAVALVLLNLLSEYNAVHNIILHEHYCTRQIKFYKRKEMRSVNIVPNLPDKVLPSSPNLVNFLYYWSAA